MKTLRLLALCLLTAPVAACSCGEDPLSKTEPTDPPIMLDGGSVVLDAGAGDAASVADAGPADSGVPEARVLSFDGTSPVALYFGATRELRFTLRTAGGAAVPAELVRFAYTGSGGALGAMTAQTDPTGAAVVRFTAGAAAGRGTLTATADRASAVNVALEVGEDPAAQLTVDVASTARIRVTTAEAQVYVGPQGRVPTCAQLLAAAPLPVPTLVASYPTVPGSSAFANQPTGSVVTAYATGANAAGAVVARGCTEGGRLAGGVNTRVSVSLAQLPSSLAGDYDALLAYDLGATIPPPIGTTVALITDLLSDPAGWIVYETLAVLDDQLGFTAVEWTPPGGTTQRRATFAEVRANAATFNVWRTARSTLDGFLQTQFGQRYTDVITIGGDVSHLVRSFEVGTGYTLTSTGATNRVQVTESWQAMVFQWRYGCPAGDLGCARREIDLTGPRANLAPARATYGASIMHAPTAAESERWSLALDAHRLVVRYGAIVLIVLDELVFPNLPSGLAANDLTGVLGNLIDCQTVASSIAGATGLPAALYEGLCDTALAAGAAYLEGQLLALDSQNNPNLISGFSPSGGGTLVLVDHDQDLQSETVERVTTYASWSTGQALTTPITGAGRARAAHCLLDGDCGPGAVCTPIPSYLKVRALENDCRAPVGARTGPVACTADADCASGLCFDAGAGRRLCYTACSGAASCATGTCRDDAAAVDLDPVLLGLGDGHADACVP